MRKRIKFRKIIYKKIKVMNRQKMMKKIWKSIQRMTKNKKIRKIFRQRIVKYLIIMKTVHKIYSKKISKKTKNILKIKYLVNIVKDNRFLIKIPKFKQSIIPKDFKILIYTNTIKGIS